MTPPRCGSIVQSVLSTPQKGKLHQKVIDAVAYTQVPVFDAAVQFARTEMILPAPESAHAIKAAIDLAYEAKQSGEAKVILFNLSGHGHFDLAAYEAYQAGSLENFELAQEPIDEAMAALPAI
jgi:tryptophan synthase beta chain